jgi:hypothetical protein
VTVALHAVFGHGLALTMFIVSLWIAFLAWNWRRGSRKMKPRQIRRMQRSAQQIESTSHLSSMPGITDLTLTNWEHLDGHFAYLTIELLDHYGKTLGVTSPVLIYPRNPVLIALTKEVTEATRVGVHSLFQVRYTGTSWQAPWWFCMKTEVVHTIMRVPR